MDDRMKDKLISTLKAPVKPVMGEEVEVVQAQPLLQGE